MAGSSSGSSRKIGRASRWGGTTHSASLYLSKHGSGYHSRANRGNRYHRSAPVCANCETKIGPFRAGPLPGQRVCGVAFKDRNDTELLRVKVEECGKRRSALDWQRYAVKAA
jgi:hypothetical protein